MSAADSDTAAKVGKSYALLGTDMLALNMGGAWTCGTDTKGTGSTASITMSCFRFVPTTTLSTAADPRFDNTKATTATLFTWDGSAATPVYKTKTLTPFSISSAVALFSGVVLSSVAMLIW